MTCTGTQFSRMRKCSSSFFCAAARPSCRNRRCCGRHSATKAPRCAYSMLYFVRSQISFLGSMPSVFLLFFLSCLLLLTSFSVLHELHLPGYAGQVIHITTNSPGGKIPSRQIPLIILGLYLINFIFTLVGGLKICQYRRVYIMSWGFANMAICHFTLFVSLLALSSFDDPSQITPSLGYLAIIMAMLVVAIFSVCLATTSILFTTEIVPLQYRNIIIPIAVFFGWLFHFTLALLMPALFTAIGAYTFMIFFILCVIIYVISNAYIETKGATEEQIAEKAEKPIRTIISDMLACSTNLTRMPSPHQLTMEMSPIIPAQPQANTRPVDPFLLRPGRIDFVLAEQAVERNKAQLASAISTAERESMADTTENNGSPTILGSEESWVPSRTPSLLSVPPIPPREGQQLRAHPTPLNIATAETSAVDRSVTEAQPRVPSDESRNGGSEEGGGRLRVHEVV